MCGGYFQLHRVFELNASIKLYDGHVLFRTFLLPIRFVVQVAGTSLTLLQALLQLLYQK